MAEPKEATYEVNSVIEFNYRCNGDQATANPVCQVLDEAAAVDAQVPVLVQIGISKLFKSSFTPDAVGVWAVHITDSNGGDVVKDFRVGTLGVQTGIQGIIVIDGKVDVVDGKIDTVDGKVTAVDGKVDTVDGKVTAVDGKVDAVGGIVTATEGKVDVVDGKVDALGGNVDAANTKLDELQVDSGGAHFG